MCVWVEDGRREKDAEGESESEYSWVRGFSMVGTMMDGEEKEKESENENEEARGDVPGSPCVLLSKGESGRRGGG